MLQKLNSKFIKVIGIILISRIVQEIGQLVLEKLLLGQDDTDDVSQQRRKTFFPLFKSTATIF